MSAAGVRFVCWVTPRDVVRSQAIELGWDPKDAERRAGNMPSGWNRGW
jgi:hypothetical protein